MSTTGGNRQIRAGMRNDHEDHRLRLSVRQFSHRMRAAAIIEALFFVMLAYVVHLILLQTSMEIPLVIAQTSYVVAWLTIALMPVLFGVRTGLYGYVVKEHWVWLSVWWAIPLDYFVVRFQYQRWSWIPVVFAGLLALGWILRFWREERFATELEHNDSYWERLLSLGVLDFLTLNYWSVQRDS